MTIPRETGSKFSDLPHSYDDDEALGECFCGRERAHELHQERPIQERAFAPRRMVVTEKGSPV